MHSKAMNKLEQRNNYSKLKKYTSLLINWLYRLSLKILNETIRVTRSSDKKLK